MEMEMDSSVKRALELEVMLDEQRRLMRLSNLTVVTLEARVEELEKANDRYKVKDDQVQFALKRLKEVLADPPWEKV